MFVYQRPGAQDVCLLGPAAHRDVHRLENRRQQGREVARERREEPLEADPGALVEGREAGQRAEARDAGAPQEDAISLALFPALRSARFGVATLESGAEPEVEEVG